MLLYLQARAKAIGYLRLVKGVVLLYRFTHRGKKVLQNCCILRHSGTFSPGYYQLHERYPSMQEADDIIAPLKSIEGVTDAFFTHRDELVVVIGKSGQADLFKPKVQAVLAKAGI
jgi:hypothetical protein